MNKGRCGEEGNLGKWRTKLVYYGQYSNRRGDKVDKIEGGGANKVS